MDLNIGLNIAGLLISLGALVASIVSMVKSSKAEKLQSKVAELDAKLKALELAEAEEGRAACVEARMIKIGKKRKVRFCNVGKSPARNVEFEVLDERSKGLFFGDHVPFPELEYQKSFDETVIAAFGIPAVIDIKVKWLDEDGVPHSKVSHLSV